MNDALSRLLAPLFLCAVALLISGCSTLVHGRTQTIELRMSPDGASATVFRWDGSVVAGPVTSPGEIVVPRSARNEPYLVVVTKPGYCPAYFAPKGDVTLVGAFEMSVGMALLAPAPVAMYGLDNAMGGLFEIYDDSFRLTRLNEAAQCR